MITFLLLLLVIIVSFHKLYYGVGLAFCIRILIPSFVRLGNTSLSLNFSISFFLLLFLLFLLLLKKSKQLDGGIYFVGGRICIEGYGISILKILVLYLLSNLLYLLLNFNISAVVQLQNNLKYFSIDFIPLFLVFYAINDYKSLQFVKRCILVSLGVASVYGIITYVIKFNPYVTYLAIIYNYDYAYTDIINEVRGALSGRVQATLSHPLVWGQLVNIAFLYIYLIDKSKKGVFSWTMIFLTAVNIILSGSRSIWLSLLIAIAFKFWMLKIRTRVLLVLFFLLTLPAAVGILKQNENTALLIKTIEASLFFWNEDKSKEIEIKGSSVSGRTAQFNGALKMVENDWVLGLGPGWIDKYMEKNGVHPVLLGFESIFFRRLIETGFVGVLFWFLFYLYLYKYTVELRGGYGNKRESKQLLGYFFSYLIALLFTDSFESFYLFLTFLILFLKESKTSTSCIKYADHV